MATSQANPIDYFAIKNTIARYCIALDSKDFALLHDVFTPDVDGKYPFNDFSSAKDLAQAIEKRLSPITSQHALTTQTIVIADDGKTADATTYFTGIHFGKGRWAGKEVTAWGKYIDRLVLTDQKAGLPGASGHWLISARKVVFMGRLGEEGVMDGE